MDLELRCRLLFPPPDLDGFVAEVTDKIDSAAVISQLDEIVYVSVSSAVTSNTIDLLEAAFALIVGIEKLGVVVDDIDDDLVDLSEIACRIGRSRETVRLWSLGRRGSGHFPMPCGVLPGSLKVWEWDAVNTWLTERHPTLADDVQLLSRLDRARFRILRTKLPETSRAA